MKTLYIPVGISGSGKTTYAKKVDATEICFDRIRKEIYGTIERVSNKNNAIFDAYYEKIKKASSSGENVYASFPNINERSIEDTIRNYYYGNEEENFDIVFILFEDSLDWKLCHNRIINDINNSVERVKLSPIVIKSQMQEYIDIKRKINAFQHVHAPFENGVANIYIETIESEDKSNESN